MNQETFNRSEFYTRAEAARELAVSISTVSRMIAEEKVLRGFRYRNRVYVPRVDVARYLKNFRQV